MDGSHNYDGESWEHEIEMYQADDVYTSDSPYWYSNLTQYLGQGTMDLTLIAIQKHAIRLKSMSYQLLQGILFHKHHNGVLSWCLKFDDAQQVLKEK